MVDKRTKHVGILLTPERHAAFKIACVKLGVTMGQCLESAAGKAIVRASLLPAGGGLAQKGDGDG